MVRVDVPMVAPEDLERRLHLGATLIASARPHLEWAAGILADLLAVVYLVDREGVVLWSSGPRPEIMRESGAVVGADWSEGAAGANAAASALQGDEPILALGSIQGAPPWRRYTAAAVPVHDLDGSVAGAVVAAAAAGVLNGDRLLLAATVAFAAERHLQDSLPAVDLPSGTARKRDDEAGRFRRVLDAAPDATLLLDESGAILYANAGVGRLLGYDASELPGRPVDVLLPGTLEGTNVPDRKRFFRECRVGDGEVSFSIDARRRDGTEVPVEVSLGSVPMREGLLVLASIRDVTGRKETLRRLEIQYAVSMALAEARNLREAGPRILEAIATRMGWVTGELWLLDPEERLLRASEVWCAPGVECEEFVLMTRSISLEKGRSMAGQVWAASVPVLASDLRQEGNFARAEAALRAGLKSGFGFPIMLGPRIIGVFGFFSRRKIALDFETRRMLGALGSQVGQFVERGRAEENLHRSEGRFRGAIESAPSAILMIDPEGRIVLANARAETLFGYGREEILGRPIEMLVPEALRQECCDLRRGLLARPESRRLGSGGDLHGLRKDGREVPLEVRVSPMAEPGGLFLLAFIEDVTERRRAARRQSALVELSRIFSEGLDVTKRLESIPSVLSSEFAEWCVIDLLGPEGLLRRSVVGHRDPARTRWAREKLIPLTLDGRAPAGAPQVVSSGRAEFYRELTESTLWAIGQDDAHVSFLREIQAASALIVPLRAGDRTLGALVLVRCAGQEPFDEGDLETAWAIAERIAFALDNARLYEQLAGWSADLERRVRERTGELEESLRELNAFSYTVAHDLRAPLRALASGAGIVLEERDRLTDEGKDWAERILQAANRMDALVTGLLAYSRLHREAIPLGPVDWDHVVDMTLELMRDEIAEKGAQIAVDRPLPRVLANDLPLSQALGNLLSNALKFVPRGEPPRVRIRAERTSSREGAPDRVRLWVEDQGIGIAPEHQERIFGVFERLHGQDLYPGTGIGLAIVRRVVERMGGKTGVESEPGRGSRFFIELPET